MSNKIRSTNDYEIFKTVRGNRTIFMPHLNRLIASIEKKNILPQNPILVNEKMQVIDGQHRLAAAKLLALPIHYIVLEGADLSDVIATNANNRGWLPQDYLESYIALGKKDYVFLKEFANTYRISISIAREILSNLKDSGSSISKFKDGTFKVEDFEQADRLASLLAEVRKHCPDMAWKHRHCLRALAILQDKIDPKVLTNQLERYQMVVTRRNSVKEYLRQFENIINANRDGKELRLDK